MTSVKDHKYPVQKNLYLFINTPNGGDLLSR